MAECNEGVGDRLTVNNALSQLAGHEQPFQQLFAHGTLQIEIYRPEKIDLQTPHTRDEIYVIASGTGMFVNGEARHSFEPGEVLFVPAGVEHRYVEFTDDFSTWVFFYGPEGGEANLSR